MTTRKLHTALVMAVALPLVSVGLDPPPMLFAATPTTAKPAVAKPRAVPQQLLDALAKVEQERQDGAIADASIKIAQAALDAGVKAKAAATAAMAADQAAFLKLWAELYGPVPPVPPPTPPVPPPVPPEPPTPPVPPEPPVPVVQPVQIVVIEETDQSTSAFSKVRNSAEIRQWATKGGHSVFFLDIDSATRAGGTWKTWADRARNTPLPYLGIAPHAGGEPIKEGPCPQDVAGFLKLVQVFGGVGKPCPGGVCPVPQGAK